MLMRYPTEEDLRMSPPQTPPAYMPLMPSLPSFILLFPSLSVLHPFKSYRRFAEASHFSLHSSRFAPIFFQHLCLPVSVPVHLPPRLILSVHPLLSLSLSLSLACFFLSFQAPPSWQTSEPTINAISFRWGNKWNSSWERGSGRRTKVFSVTPTPSACPSLCTRSLSPSHTQTHRPAVHQGTPWPYWHLQKLHFQCNCALWRNSHSHVHFSQFL